MGSVRNQKEGKTPEQEQTMRWVGASPFLIASNRSYERPLRNANGAMGPV
jgi:hypothetical protein